MDYKPEIPSQYKGKQIILASGRLIFNAKEDAIMMFSKKAIGFSSAGTINFDSDDYHIVNAPKIYLGLFAHQEKEPLLLGNKTNDLLKELSNSLNEFAELIKTGDGSPHSLMAASGLLNGRLKEIIKIIERNELLSKQNFTV